MNDADELTALLRRRVADVEPGEELWPVTARRARRALRRRRVRQLGGVVAAMLVVVGISVTGVERLGGARTAFGPASPVLLPAAGPNRWSPAFAAPIGGRTGHTATWTGDRMVVWGGWAPSDRGTPAFADGAALVLAQDGWLPVGGAPVAPRHGHTAVWTGTELVVWGGLTPDGTPLADGAAYDPGAGSWRRLPPAPLEGRSGHGVVWTGAGMVVWGGTGEDGAVADGAVYDPAGDTWRELPSAPLGPRSAPVAVWTGAEVLLVGGVADDPAGFPVDGAAYDPAAARWRPLPAAPGPGMAGAAAAWTGDRLLVVGGDGAVGGAPTTTNQALEYDPVTDAWDEVVPPPLGPLSRAPHVWTGTSFVVWGGGTPDHARTDGAAFDPVVGRWRPLPPAPLDGRGGATAVWAGDRMVVWGGSEVQVSGGQRADGAAFTPSPVGGGTADLTAGEQLRTLVAEVDRDDATAVVAAEGGEQVVAGGPDRPVVGVAALPAVGPWLGAIVVVDAPGGYGFDVVGGPRRDRMPRAVDVALPAGLLVPPAPRFSPDGRTLAWLEQSTEREVVLVHAGWHAGSEQLGPIRRVPLEVPREPAAPGTRPGPGPFLHLASWSQTDLAGGGAAIRLQLLADPPGRPAGAGTPYGLLMERTPQGTLAVPDPQLVPGDR